jgi:hypothetical protein
MWSVVFLVVVFGLFSVPQTVFGQQLAPGDNPPPRRCLIVAAIALAVYRVAGFHPYFRTNYLRWLKSTPWNVKKPLPLGPVELVPEDALGIGLILLLAATLPEPRSIEIVNIFLFSHMIITIGTFWRTGAAAFGYVALMLLGFVPLLWSRPWLALALNTGVHLLVHEGLWRSLASFPWDTDGLLSDLTMVQTTDANPQSGWFFDRFHRDIGKARGISRTDAVLGCMLGSWWLFVVSSLAPSPQEQIGILIGLVGAVMTMTPLGRLMIYHQGCRPPITLWGRITTFRWIIPGYDQVMIGPICSFLTAPALMCLFWSSPVPREVVLSVAAGLTVLVALVSPPRLKKWRLTGHHRLVPTLQESQTANLHKMGQP